MTHRPASYATLVAPEPAFATHHEALAAREATERLKAHALSALTAIAPATIAWYFGVDRRLRASQAIVLNAADSPVEPAQMWHRYVGNVAAEDPFAARRVEQYGVAVLAFKDFDPQTGARYRAYLEQQGLADRADVYLFNAGTIIGQFALLRGPELPPFERQDLTALRRLQPLLEQAFACASDPELPDLRVMLAQSGLSEREMDVAELVARGSTNGEIARSLFISEATVKTHLTRVFTKVGVRTRTQLALALGDDDRTTCG